MKIFVFIILVIMGWCLITLSDEMRITNSSKWFNWGDGESYNVVEDNTDYIIIKWNKYFTNDNGNWEVYVPPASYGEDYLGQVVWTQWNQLKAEVNNGNINYFHYAL